MFFALFSPVYKVGDTARELAIQNGFKTIAKLLGPAKGDPLRVSIMILRENKRYDIEFQRYCF